MLRQIEWVDIFMVVSRGCPERFIVSRVLRITLHAYYRGGGNHENLLSSDPTDSEFTDSRWGGDRCHVAIVWRWNDTG